MVAAGRERDNRGVARGSNPASVRCIKFGAPGDPHQVVLGRHVLPALNSGHVVKSFRTAEPYEGATFLRFPIGTALTVSLSEGNADLLRDGSSEAVDFHARRRVAILGSSASLR